MVYIEDPLLLRQAYDVSDASVGVLDSASNANSNER